MGTFNELFDFKPDSLVGTDYFFIDGDTLNNPNGPNYRLRGFDTAEVSKMLHTGEFKEGTAGGRETASIVSRLANEQGYNNVVPQFNPDGSLAMDNHGRQLIELHNKNGESFGTEMLNSGAMDMTRYSTDGDRMKKYQAEADRDLQRRMGTYEPSDFDKAAIEIKDAEEAEGARSLGFKKTLATEADRGAYVNYFMQAEGLSRSDAIVRMNDYFNITPSIGFSGVDRNYTSLNPKMDSLKQGMIGVGESAFGMANLLGHVSDIEGLENWGEQGVKRQREKQKKIGYLLNNYKEIEGAGDVFEYLGNTMAMSLPYMATIAAATVAAPVTFGLSYTVPVSVYAGQNWNEMEGPNENKSASIAIGAAVAMTVADRFGLQALKGVGGSPTAMLQQHARNLAARDGITLPTARKMVKESTDEIIAQFSKEVHEKAKEQLKSAATTKRILKDVGVGSLGEGLTEVAQEAIGYTAAVAGSDKQFDYQELEERLINAAVAGSALGAGFSVPGTVKDQLGWMDAAARYGVPLEPTDIERYESEELNSPSPDYSTNGMMDGVETLLSKAAVKIAKTKPAPKGKSKTKVKTKKPSLQPRKDAHRVSQGSKTYMERASEAVMNASNLWQSHITNTFTKDLLDKSRAARALHSILGGGLTNLHSGSGFEAAQHHLMTAYTNQVSHPATFWKASGLPTFAGVHRSSQKAKMSDEIYAAWKAARDNNGVFYPDRVPQNTPNRGLVISLGNELIALGTKLRNDQIASDPELNMGLVESYLQRYRALDKRAVQNDPEGFKKALMSIKFKSGKKISAAQAQEIVDDIIDNPLVDSLSDAMSSNIGSLNPSSHKKRTLDLSEQEGFDAFYERDVFANVAKASKSAARFITQMKYVGKDGEVISHFLDQMEAEGVPREEVNKVASRVFDGLEAVSGNYNRPTTQAGKKLMRFQKNVMFWMTLSALPLATFSSLPELAMSQGALTKDQIFGENNSIKAIATEFSAAFIPLLRKVEDGSDDDVLKPDTYSKGQRILNEVMGSSWEVGAATTVGVKEASENRKEVMEFFFKAIGLTQFTDYTRAVRASFAYDFMSYNAKIISNGRMGRISRDDNYKTRQEQEAEQKLRSIGIPIEEFVEMQIGIEDQGLSFFDNPGQDLLNPNSPMNLRPVNSLQQFETMVKEGTYNFINQTVPLPGAMNRPLIYQDPRFALFTQFQGFISTFTANQIPRMWNDYIKRGSPSMKFNTFAIMSTMIALGFFSQAIKDSIKFDDDDDEGTLGNPYLNKPEYIRRGIMASGLLGTGERVVDIFAPIYGQRSDGGVGWVYAQATGESPSLGYLARGGTSLSKLAQGDVEGSLYNAMRMAPGIAPFTEGNKSLASLLTGGGWNYKDNEE